MAPDADAPPRNLAPVAEPAEFAPGRLRLDHELLSRLGPEATFEEWETTLRRAGLLALEPGGSERGVILGELQMLVRGDPNPATGGAAHREAFGRMRILATAGVVGLLSAAYFDWAIGVPIAALATFVAWFAVSPPSRVAADRRIPRAHALLRRLLRGSFVDVVGATVVEHLPQRDYLVLRLDEVEACLGTAESRLVELATTIDGIRAANTRLGRLGDDEDVARLTAAIGAESLARDRLLAARNSLRSRLDRLDLELERLRDQAIRLALSERAARLTDGAALDRSLQAAASLEVDVPEIEAELAPLAIASRANDARIRALLEMVSTTRPRR